MEEKSKHGSRNLDTGKAYSPVWLIKCPVVVAKSWTSHNTVTDPHPLAKVVLCLDPLSTDDFEFKMEMAGGGGQENLPKSYALSMSKEFVPMCVFSETNQGKVSTEGKVDHKFDMRPLLHGTANLEGYGKLCRERQNKSMIKNRQVQVIDNVSGLMHTMRPMNPSSSSKDKKKTGQLLPAKQSDMKRTRGDRGQVVDMVFKLFEKQPNWSFRQLVKETDQPEQFLKEILNELCVYNKRGTNQGTYQLKPEYVVPGTTS